VQDLSGLHALSISIEEVKKMNNHTYSVIADYRKVNMKEAASNHFKLNELHDNIIKQVLEISLREVLARYGPPPSPFSFFVMGSAGRFEQSVWSDQDHGIIYLDQSAEAKAYFLSLGKEVSKGLYQVGYPYCDGGVMSGNPFWCKSKTEWEKQTKNWALDASWESLRYLLIFIDGRSVYGQHQLLEQLKNFLYQIVHEQHLLSRISKNTQHFKKGIGVIGQLLVETHGVHTGSLNLKETALFPYVNAVRLLAIQENLLETSTLSRLDKLQFHDKDFYKAMFLKLLNYRLLLASHKDYESGHYLPADLLTKEQKNDVKDIIKHGVTLHQYVRKLLDKEG
jgi:CBS domain-containing protein